MNRESIREFCLSLPHVTEDIQWEVDLLFRIGGKMFAVMNLESEPVTLSFKCTPEEFGELTQIDGIITAPYVARYHWVQIQRPGVLKTAEVKRLIKDSYQMVYDKLPGKLKKSLSRNH